MILDTGFIVDLFKGKKNAVEKMQSLSEKGDAYFVSAVTLHELWTGVTLSIQEEQEKARIKQTLESIDILNFDVFCAQISGMVNGKLMKDGKMIGSEDCMIAGTALYHKLPLLTKDEHFKRIHGLKIENY